MQLEYIIKTHPQEKFYKVSLKREKTEYNDYCEVEVFHIGSYFSTSRTRLFSVGDLNKSIARITLNAKHGKSGHGTFGIGPGSALGMLPGEHQNQGIITFCATLLFDQLLDEYPDYSFHRGKLSHVDAQSEKTKLNRNNFYENLNFRLDFSDYEKDITDPKECGKHGYFYCDDVASLRRDYNKEKIQVLTASDFQMLMLQNAKLEKDVTELNQTNAYLRESRTDLEKIIGSLSNWRIGLGAICLLLVGFTAFVG